MKNILINILRFVRNNRWLIIIIVGPLFFYKALSATLFRVVLSWDIGFMDSASPFMESLVDLYFIVWYMLIIVLVGVIYILVRIIYLFSWNLNYLDSVFLKNFYNSLVNIYIYFVFIISNITDKYRFISFIKRFSSKLAGINLLNIWYGKTKAPFLSVQNISEYKRLEIAWCALPSAALVSIGSPTFGLIFALDPAIDPAVTLKIIGHQWYWTYEYDITLKVAKDSPEYEYTDRARFVKNWMALVNYDQKPIFDMSLTEMLDAEFIDKKKRITSRDWEIFYRGIMDHKPYVHYSVTFDSVMVATEDLEDGAKRLLDVTSYTVLPVAAPIKMLITSADVLHSWTVPNLGIKVDAVPGRINQFMLEIKHPAYFYGQCSELCGGLHGYMPITLHAVTEEEFENWVKKVGQIV